MPDDPDALRRAATAAFARPGGEADRLARLALADEAVRHPLVEGLWVLVDWPSRGPLPRTVTVHLGSVAPLAEAEPGFDATGAVQAGLAAALADLAAERDASVALRSEGDLFVAHAAFRRGEPVPPAWYRRGEPLAPGMWAVDLDLFFELRLRRSDLGRLRGQRIELAVLGERLPLEVPEDADPDEAWTLPGAGLFDEAADALEEDEADERSGDLHVLPIVAG